MFSDKSFTEGVHWTNAKKMSKGARKRKLEEMREDFYEDEDSDFDM